MNGNNNQDIGLSKISDFEKRFLRLAGKINRLESIDDLLSLLRKDLLEVFEIDMASIFLIDSLKMQLVSWLVLPGESVRKIRIPINEVSIAGYTASSRQMVLIRDPYDTEELRQIDPALKFDSSWDRQTGIRTRQILATPIMFKHSLLGVIQLMNKRNGMPFGNEDQQLIKDLALSIGSTLLALQKA